VDVLIVLSRGSKKERGIYSDHPLYMGVEYTLCWDEELICWLGECRTIALDAMYYGMVAFDDGFWMEAREVFRELEKKYGFARNQLLKKLAPL